MIQQQQQQHIFDPSLLVPPGLTAIFDSQNTQHNTQTHTPFMIGSTPNTRLYAVNDDATAGVTSVLQGLSPVTVSMPITSATSSVISSPVSRPPLIMDDNSSMILALLFICLFGLVSWAVRQVLGMMALIKKGSSFPLVWNPFSGWSWWTGSSSPKNGRTERNRVEPHLHAKTGRKRTKKVVSDQPIIIPPAVNAALGQPRSCPPSSITTFALKRDQEAILVNSRVKNNHADEDDEESKKWTSAKERRKEKRKAAKKSAAQVPSSIPLLALARVEVEKSESSSTSPPEIIAPNEAISSCFLPKVQIASPPEEAEFIVVVPKSKRKASQPPSPVLSSTASSSPSPSSITLSPASHIIYSSSKSDDGLLTPPLEVLAHSYLSNSSLQMEDKMVKPVYRSIAIQTSFLPSSASTPSLTSLASKRLHSAIPEPDPMIMLKDTNAALIRSMALLRRNSEESLVPRTLTTNSVTQTEPPPPPRFFCTQSSQTSMADIHRPEEEEYDDDDDNVQFLQDIGIQTSDDHLWSSLSVTSSTPPNSPSKACSEASAKPPSPTPSTVSILSTANSELNRRREEELSYMYQEFAKSNEIITSLQSYLDAALDTIRMNKVKIMELEAIVQEHVEEKEAIDRLLNQVDSIASKAAAARSDELLVDLSTALSSPMQRDEQQRHFARLLDKYSPGKLSFGMDIAIPAEEPIYSKSSPPSVPPVLEEGVLEEEEEDDGTFYASQVPPSSSPLSEEDNLHMASERGSSEEDDMTLPKTPTKSTGYSDSAIDLTTVVGGAVYM